jgi:hypothetical protein
LNRGGASNVAKGGDPSRHIGSLGGKKAGQPAASDPGKNLMRGGKGAPVVNDHRPSIPAAQNFKGKIPFGKGKGK